MPDDKNAASNRVVKYKTIKTKTGWIRVAIVRRKPKAKGNTSGK